MKKIVSFIWLLLRISIYLMIFLISLDKPVLYLMCVILFTCIEFRKELISVFHDIVEKARNE